MSDFDSNELKELLALKEKGNNLFKAKNFLGAIEEYSKSIHLAVHHKDVLSTVLSNRAACYLKLEKFKECKEDCTAVLEIDGSHKKAYFRMAQADEQLGNLKDAFNNLSHLLHIDAKNVEAISMMRRIKTLLEKDKQQDSEVNRILHVLTSTPSSTEDCLRSLIGLCADDVSHALDLFRKGGVQIVGDLIEQKLSEEITDPQTDHHSTVLALRVLTAASTHDRFVKLAVVLGINTDALPPPLASTSAALLDNGRLSWPGICHLLCHSDTALSQTASSLALRVLKCLPAGIEKPYDPQVEAEKQAAIQAERAKRLAEKKAKMEQVEEDEDRPRVEVLDDNVEETEKKKQLLEEEIKRLEKETKKSASDSAPEASDETKKSDPATPKSVPIKDYDLYLRRYPAVLALRGWLAGIARVGLDPHHAPESLEAFTMASDAFAAFFSEVEDYIGHEKIVDARMEGVEERKFRIGKVRLGKLRAKTHAEWAVAEGAIDILVQQLDSDHGVVRQRAGACFGRMVAALDDDEVLKGRLQKHLIGHDQLDLQPGDPLPAINLCRTRAALEATLFLCRPEVGKWALGEKGGVQQLLILISTQDSRCQEITAEVLCLASASEGGGALLAPIVSSGSLQTLMMSANPNTRAAAAAAMTKLSLQAKALKQDSPETAQMLHVVLEVLKASAEEFKESHNSTSKNSKEKKKEKELVSFSAIGDSFFSKKGIKDADHKVDSDEGR
jgi:tetratricopeptide (TPR) repeat protein